MPITGAQRTKRKQTKMKMMTSTTTTTASTTARNIHEIEFQGFSEPETNLIKDALDGCFLVSASAPRYLTDMSGSQAPDAGEKIRKGKNGRLFAGKRVFSGLEYEVLKASNEFALPAKWSVNGVELLRKIRVMPPGAKQDFLSSIAVSWNPSASLSGKNH